MSTLFEAVNRPRRRGLGDARRQADQEAHTSRYLTDVVNLYRFLGCIAGRAGRLAGLENRRSLDIMLVPLEELCSERLRAVMTIE
jgi:hypothetical protein